MIYKYKWGRGPDHSTRPGNQLVGQGTAGRKQSGKLLRNIDKQDSRESSEKPSQSQELPRVLSANFLQKYIEPWEVLKWECHMTPAMELSACWLVCIGLSRSLEMERPVRDFERKLHVRLL